MIESLIRWRCSICGQEWSIEEDAQKHVQQVEGWRSQTYQDRLLAEGLVGQSLPIHMNERYPSSPPSPVLRGRLSATITNVQEGPDGCGTHELRLILDLAVPHYEESWCGGGQVEFKPWVSYHNIKNGRLQLYGASKEWTYLEAEVRDWENRTVKELSHE